MRLADFYHVEALVHAREHLVQQHAECPRIEVSIGGHVQSRSFVDNVERTLRLELRHQIHDLDKRLEALGVDVG